MSTARAGELATLHREIPVRALPQPRRPLDRAVVSRAAPGDAIEPVLADHGRPARGDVRRPRDRARALSTGSRSRSTRCSGAGSAACAARSSPASRPATSPTSACPDLAPPRRSPAPADAARLPRTRDDRRADRRRVVGVGRSASRACRAPARRRPRAARRPGHRGADLARRSTSSRAGCRTSCAATARACTCAATAATSRASPTSARASRPTSRCCRSAASCRSRFATATCRRSTRCSRSRICARACSCRSITARSRCRTKSSTSRRAGSSSSRRRAAMRDHVLVMAAGETERFDSLITPLTRDLRDKTPDRAPDVSIVIPVYNEEGILREAVTELLDGLDTVRAALHAPELDVRDHHRRERLARSHGRARGAPRERAPRGPHVLARRAELRQGAAARHPRGARHVGDLRGDRSVRPRLPSPRARAPAPRRRRHGRRLEGDEGLERSAADDAPRRDARDQRHAARRASTSAAPTPTASRRSTATTLVPIVEACVIDRDLFASELVIRAGQRRST